MWSSLFVSCVTDTVLYDLCKLFHAGGPSLESLLPGKLHSKGHKLTAIMRITDNRLLCTDAESLL